MATRHFIRNRLFLVLQHLSLRRMQQIQDYLEWVDYFYSPEGQIFAYLEKKEDL